jgi:hypothetical protein
MSGVDSKAAVANPAEETTQRKVMVTPRRKRKKKRCIGQEKPESITLGTLVQPKGIFLRRRPRERCQTIYQPRRHSRVSKVISLVLHHAEL